MCGDVPAICFRTQVRQQILQQRSVLSHACWCTHCYRRASMLALTTTPCCRYHIAVMLSNSLKLHISLLLIGINTAGYPTQTLSKNGFVVLDWSQSVSCDAICCGPCAGLHYVPCTNGVTAGA